jgi:hypothetical protein
MSVVYFVSYSENYNKAKRVAWIGDVFGYRRDFLNFESVNGRYPVSVQELSDFIFGPVPNSIEKHRYGMSFPNDRDDYGNPLFIVKDLAGGYSEVP